MKPKFHGSEKFEKEKSYVTGIKSFSDNVSVSSSLNYRVTISERGLRDVPVTIAATRSILLLDSLPVSPRSSFRVAASSILPPRPPWKESENRRTPLFV